jgi:hypothetical protein
MDSLLVGIRHSVVLRWSNKCQFDADLQDDAHSPIAQPPKVDGFVRTVDAIRSECWTGSG